MSQLDSFEKLILDLNENLIDKINDDKTKVTDTLNNILKNIEDYFTEYEKINNKINELKIELYKEV
jgi:hypothetical protein